MEFIKRNDTLSVKVKEIDEQHQQLVKYINELYEAFMRKEHHDKVVKIIDNLGNYALTHFVTEETYFKKFYYDGSAAHEAEHNDFKKKVVEFQDKYKANSSMLTFEVLTFLQKWLLNHIKGSDMKYVECFRRNGLK